jgi:hypothetical protein
MSPFFLICLTLGTGNLMDGCLDAVVGRAAADIAGHSLFDLGVCRPGVLGQ